MRSICSEDAEFELLEALRHNRRKREQRGEFLVEGVQAINRCLDAGWPVRAALVRDGSERSRWADSCLARVAEVIEVRPDLFARLTDREDPPELLPGSPARCAISRTSCSPSRWRVPLAP